MYRRGRLGYGYPAGVFHKVGLLDETRGAGWHEVSWDGRDGDGNAVSSGVYFVRLRTDSGVESRKLVKIR